VGNGDTARELIRLRETVRRQEKALETQGDKLTKEIYALQSRLEHEINTRRWVERENNTVRSILFYLSDHGPAPIKRWLNERLKGETQVRARMIEEAVK
jgi:predicted transcriptional regulator